MIHIKQKNPINIDQVTVTKAIRFSILHYAMLALMITCIILRAQQQQNRTQVAGGVSTELKITPSDISESKDLKGNRESQFQDCAYTVRMQKTAYEIASCLVGSEMCIRDSASGVSTELKTTPSDISESKDLKGNRESQFQDCAYTVRMQKTVTAWEHLTLSLIHI